MSKRILAVALLALLFFDAPCRAERPGLRGRLRERIAERQAERRDTAELTTATIDHGGRERTYHVQLPPGHTTSKSWPLIVAMHGGGGNGKRMNSTMTNGTLSAATNRAGFVVVYPEAFDKRWNDGRQLAAWKSHQLNVDDVGFISAVIDRLTSKYKIDPNRIYATGISNGGLMSYRLALDTDRFAAIAAVVADLPEKVSERKPPRPVSVMIMNGTEDPLMPYEGGDAYHRDKHLGRFLSSQRTAEFWAKQNGCGPEPSALGAPEGASADSRVRRQVFSEGKDGTEVILYSITGGGHAWPGGKQYMGSWMIGKVYPNLNASEVIVSFFQRHKRK